MSRGRVIPGFDYVTRQALSLSREDWQQRIRLAVQAGGRRRVEHGETFIHGPQGHLEAEIYDNVQEGRA